LRGRRRFQLSSLFFTFGNPLNPRRSLQRLFGIVDDILFCSAFFVSIEYDPFVIETVIIDTYFITTHIFETFIFEA
jgi:hypothetical protein